MRIVRRKDIKAKVGFTYHWAVKLEQRGEFPRRIRLGPNAVGWLEHELDEWLASRPREPLPAVEMPAAPEPVS